MKQSEIEAGNRRVQVAGDVRECQRREGPNDESRPSLNRVAIASNLTRNETLPGPYTLPGARSRV